jgi:hypothetical protein|nr:relaxase/mobilization nuclease domain-containing protein [uncultured Lachnoclostridium sp.]
MCIVKFANNDYYDISSLYRELIYVTNPEKCLHQCKGTQDVISDDIDYIYQQFLLVKSVYNKNDGKPFHHLIISLKYKDTWDYNDAWVFANHSLAYLPSEYQILYAVHEDHEYLHIHYIINSINWFTGNRLNVNVDMINWISQSTNNLEQFMNQKKQYEMKQAKKEEERIERTREIEMLKLIKNRA